MFRAHFHSSFVVINTTTAESINHTDKHETCRKTGLQWNESSWISEWALPSRWPTGSDWCLQVWEQQTYFQNELQNQWKLKKGSKWMESEKQDGGNTGWDLIEIDVKYLRRRNTKARNKLKSTGDRLSVGEPHSITRKLPMNKLKNNHV